MALNSTSLDVICKVINTLNKESLVKKRVISLGYPDILTPKEDIGKLFGNEIVNELQFREDSDKIIRWHNVVNISEIVETVHFFSLLGYSLDILDISKVRGPEIIADLNEPISEKLNEQYALVIDAGTIEHCFNIGQAIKNLANMVCLNGYAFQSNPISMFNHGFYNLNPTFYYDFYNNNGFTVESCQLVVPTTGGWRVYDISHPTRLTGITERSIVNVVAKRITIQSFEFPRQTKYLINPNLHN